ncbi:MAG: DUF4097 family beta strand repeat-containing protein [bacterium]
MNERLRILNLLEQGKINSDEAARLLEALAQSDRGGKRNKFKLWHSLEGLPEIISTAIETSTKHDDSSQTLQFPQKDNIEFKGISGDINIIGESRDTVEVQKDGFVRTKEKDDILIIKALSGDINILTNHNTNLMIKDISGDIDITDLTGKTDIESVSGDINGKGMSGSLSVKIVSGDIDFEYLNVDEVNIESRSGDITLKLLEKVEAEINIETGDGNIMCDFELKNEEKSARFLRGVINEPKAKINIKNKSGDVSIEKMK